MVGGKRADLLPVQLGRARAGSGHVPKWALLGRLGRGILVVLVAVGGGDDRAEEDRRRGRALWG